MNRIFLLLGSNIEKEVNLPAAVVYASQHLPVLKLSSVYETIPMGLKEQPNFFNMAVLIETDLDPCQIKRQIIQPIEIELQRQRKADKNAPRTIDLDIVLYNDEVFDYIPGNGRLHHLPDPDILRFAHVAVPLAELAPAQNSPGNRPAAFADRGAAYVESWKEGLILLWKREDFLIDQTRRHVVVNRFAASS